MKNKFFFVMTGMLCVSMGITYALENELITLTRQLNVLASALSIHVSTESKSQVASSGKITNERLWIEAYKKHTFSRALGAEWEFARSQFGHIWTDIARRNAITQDKVEDVLIEYIINYAEWNGNRPKFSQSFLNQIESYLQNPSRASAEKYSEGVE